MKSLALAITITTLVVALSLYFVVDTSDKSDSVAAQLFGLDTATANSVMEVSQ